MREQKSRGRLRISGSTQRLLDLALTSAGLLVLAPVLIITGGAVRLKLGSPIIFRQMRPGLHARPFHLLKFRTMTNSCDADGRLLDDARRLTTLGGFLRRTSLDELPELINVLRGDMSLVGPRPLRMQYLDRYTRTQFQRHNVRPGITGWAQVNGRNSIDWEERFKLDIWYVNNRSLTLDLRILWMTVAAVIRREGISQEGHVTMPEFEGEARSQRVRDRSWRQ